MLFPRNLLLNQVFREGKKRSQAYYDELDVNIQLYKGSFEYLTFFPNRTNLCVKFCVDTKKVGFQDGNYLVFQ